MLWNGKNVLRLGREFRRVLGCMPQQQNLYDSFTGRRFLLYLAALKEIPREKAAAAPGIPLFLLFALPPLLSASGLTGAKWLGVYPLFHMGVLFASGTRIACFLLLFIAAAGC